MMKTEQERIDAARAFLERRGFVVSRSKNAVKAHLLTQREAAELLTVSERRFAELRHEPWFPKPICLGPRSHRFDAEELLAAVRDNAPRADVADEPEMLKTAREQHGDALNTLRAATAKVRASAAELGMTIEEWNRKFGT